LGGKAHRLCSCSTACSCAGPPLLLHRLSSMKNSRNLSQCCSIWRPSHAPSSSCGRHFSSASARTCSCPCSHSLSGSGGWSSNVLVLRLDLHALQTLRNKVPVLPAPVAHARAPLSVLSVHVYKHSNRMLNNASSSSPSTSNSSSGMVKD
jgi:hypothetical protein